MTRTDLPRLLLALAALACDARVTPSAPRPLEVRPGVGFTTGADVEIAGESFDVLPVQDVGATHSDVRAQYRAWLSATELTGVTWVDARTLRAHVPPGLALGKHDLTVEGPFGRGALPGAYEVIDRVDVIAADALGQSTFAFVAGYRGQIVVGPNATGDTLALLPLDGGAPQTVGVRFGHDVTGANVASNGSASFASIGFTDCATTNACGPDGENGRGFLTSVTFAEDEWLVLGGARSLGELDYVYLSNAPTSAPSLDFSYVDVGGLLGAATRGFTAAAVASGRLYLGFADNGGSRPYGLALITAPPTFSATSPGLDVTLSSQAIELQLHDAYNTLYGGAFTTITMIDAIGELNGHVYLFNDIGCIGSTTATPLSKNDFFRCSPADGSEYDYPDYNLVDAVDPTQQFDLEPRDRAWPQVAVWNGRLFAARNTTTGPQLWSCDPSRRGDPLLCEPGDWQLVAADATYRTRLGNPGASAATLVVATPTALFVGFDDPVAGIHVYRTSVPDPAVASDFAGKGGCVAGTVGCEGIGGDGLRFLGIQPPPTRIFDAKAVATPESRTDLFFTTGDGASPVRVIRMAP